MEPTNPTIDIDYIYDYNASNITNHTHSATEELFPLPFTLLIYVLYNAIFLSAVLGNSCVLYIIASSPRMRTTTNYLIANLALGDLLMALLCVPFSYLPVLKQQWPYGSLLCHLVSPSQAICVFVSAYTLVALAIDRYVAIIYPLKPRLRRSQVIYVVLAVWAFAIITSMGVAVNTRLVVVEGRSLCLESAWPSSSLKLIYSLTLTILQYFLPITVLIFTYTRIALVVWGKRKARTGEAEEARDARLAKAKRKTTKTTLIVISGYTLAWLPLNVLNISMELLDVEWEVRYLFFACHVLAMGSTTFNWIVYGMLQMMLTTTSFYTLSWLPFNLLIISWDLSPGHTYFGDYTAYVYFLLHFLAMLHTVMNPIIYCAMNERWREGFGGVVCWGRRRNMNNERSFTTYSFVNHGNRVRKRDVVAESFI